jgi:3-deoxy-D-manno-octulosonic-acid transferase
MDKIAEYKTQQRLLEKAGARVKFGSATNNGGWMIEVVITDHDGVGDLLGLYSVAEVAMFIGSFCPICEKVDRRRTRGGPCQSCISSGRRP